MLVEINGQKERMVPHHCGDPRQHDCWAVLRGDRRVSAHTLPNNLKVGDTIHISGNTYKILEVP